MSEEKQDLLVMNNIVKNFGGVKALQGVDLRVTKGEIHCLAGENGSGKSTLIKVISGVHRPDDGEIWFKGLLHKEMTPYQAIETGIQVIYQDFSLFPNLTVSENLAYNKLLRLHKKTTCYKQTRLIAQQALERINLSLDLDLRVETLPVADRQMIAIARALIDDLELLIMDEPTTALTRKEINRLFEVVEQMKRQGVTILFVSHKINEVFELSDRITVLRNGRNVITCAVGDMNEEKFTHAMTGRSFTKTQSLFPAKPEVVLTVRELELKSYFEDINFTLYRREILGIMGQLGSGQRELAMTLFGMYEPTRGRIEINGDHVSSASIQWMLKHGVAFLPEDRLAEGLFLPQSITRNVVVSSLDELCGWLGFLDQEKLTSQACEWVRQLSIISHDVELPVQTLSGGNQQKVVLARCLSVKPDVLILNGPTVGVDIGAKYDIHELLRNLAAQGVSILVISDDISELMAICHRVLVMREGHFIAEFHREEFSQEIFTHSIV